MESHSKFKYFVIFFILVLFGAGIFLYRNLLVNKTPVVSEVIDIRKFSGQIVSMDGNLITVRGRYAQGSNISVELSNPRVFHFFVDDKTIFEKDEISWPSWESLRATGATNGTVDISKLPHESGTVTLVDFQKSMQDTENLNNIMVEVSFGSTIYKVDKPLAQKLFYKKLIMPK
jgi:hypothetical protein